MMLNRLSLNRIGLNRIGLNRIGKPSGGSSDRPYIDPKVLDSLCGVWIMDQNTNESESRNIIKNKIADRGGDLELLNFAYKANSGYNGYPEDFTSWNYNTGLIVSPTKVQNNGDAGRQLIYYHTSIRKEDVLEFKVKITLDEQSKIKYWYIKEDGTGTNITYSKSGTYTIPTSYFSKYTGENTWFGFEQLSGGCIIEQLPLYEGALVTDGKDDMIVSQKTVQEMLGGSNVCTVVSMIHQINLSTVSSITSINNIRSESVAHVCARHLNRAYGKTGIFGYSKQLNTINKPTLINNILGDKNDYTVNGASVIDTTDKYFVQGYKYNDSLYELSEVAVYWTFIANKVLTTDEINQIIGYFKLDKYVIPQVIYDVKRQGLTNDTPDSDWYLKDFSKNGFDMTLYNFAKKLGSGIGKYEVDFNTWIPQSYVADSAYTSNKLHITNIKGGNAILYTKKGANAMKVKITGIQSFNLVYRYIAENDVWEALEVDRDGIYELPASTTTTKTYYTGFTVPYYTGDCDITIEQIPDYEGALVSDGKDDYGKVENLPIYKDYTVAIDRAWTNDLVKAQCLTSKLNGDNFGSFSFELIENGFSSYSFGISNKGVITIDSNKKISYQSKYVYNGSPIISGNNVDGKDLFLFRNRDSYPYYAEAAIWSYILFPYTLSEFLLERQLKRYKLGTLYPDMVEFRPVISGNIPYNAIEISQGSTTLYNKSINKTGIYLQEGSTVRVYIQPSGIDEVSKITVNGVEYTDLPINPNGFYYADFPIAKSPQKISYAIDEYIRYEDIVQPYPAIINLKQDGKTITWGDKLKVGSDIVFAGSANLLPELYTVSETRYNGVTLYPNTIIKVEKSMVFDNARTYLKANEPSCILSPNRLRIPNSSYKILGYIPDLTGKGNHGKLNNFAYTEDSGVAADGSIKFNGTDDHITIPTLAHGGKCVMMKVNSFETVNPIYEQRNPNIFSPTFCIFMNSGSIAYVDGNNGKTYIDGVLNSSITGNNLVNILHNITVTNENITTANSVSPKIGVLNTTNTSYADMAMYEFMLFPEIPSEDEIKKLNDVMGIEGGYIESPNYYWDAYGKKNTDTDRNLIADQVSKDVANALEVKNVAYNSESGYTDNNGLLLDGVEDHAVNTVIPAVTDFTVIAKREWLGDYQPSAAFVTKGTSNTYTKAAFMMEYKSSASIQIGSFGILNSGQNMPDLITYMTPIDYNKAGLSKGTAIDENGLIMGKYSNTYYWKGVFYKLMFYTKTIDQLSINMLKNLFERDELIDVTNPIFKKQ